jgi:hypothetical protein
MDRERVFGVDALRRALLELRVETRQAAACSDDLETFSRQNIDVAHIVIELHRLLPPTCLYKLYVLSPRHR